MKSGPRAKKAYQKALALDQKDAQAWALYSTFLGQWSDDATQGDGEAEAHLSKALSLDEEIADKIYSCGDLENANIEFAEAAFSFATANTLYQRTSNEQGEADSLEYLANTCLSLCQYQEVIEYSNQHLSLARRIGDKQGEADSLGNLAMAHTSMADFRSAIYWSQHQLALAEELGYKYGQSDALHNMGNAHRCLAKYHEAIDLYNRDLDLARELQDQQRESCALGNIGRAYYGLSEFKHAMAYHVKDLMLAQKINNKQGEASALGNIGRACHGLSDFPHAMEYHMAQLTLAAEIGERLEQSLAHGDLGNVYRFLGQLDQAAAHYLMELRLGRELDDRQGEADALGNLGVVAHLCGAHEESRRLMEGCLVTTRETGWCRMEGHCEHWLGVIALAEGGVETAIATQRKGLALAVSIQNRELETFTLIGLAAALLAQEKTKLRETPTVPLNLESETWREIKTTVKRAQSVAEAIHSSSLVEDSLYHQAMVAEVEGNAEAASTQLAACISMCTTSKEQIKLERALRALHRVSVGLGNAEAASKYLQQADDIIERLDLPALRTFILSRKISISGPKQ